MRPDILSEKYRNPTDDTAAAAADDDDDDDDDVICQYWSLICSQITIQCSIYEQ